MSVVSPELETPARLLGPAVGELVLRIRGPVRHGQLVRLTSQKCTVGSAPNCTLRLRLPGVREVHCVILRGATETIVRRWSPDTRLNGATFTDAALKVGDRLSIGPLEFEVVSDGMKWTPPGLARSASKADREADKPEEPTPAAEQPSVTRRLESAVAQTSQRTKRLIEKLDQAKRSVAGLEDLAAQRQAQLAAFADRLTQLEARARLAESAPASEVSAAADLPAATTFPIYLPPPAANEEKLTSILQAVGELQAEMSRERQDREETADRLRSELAASRILWEQAADRLANITLPVVPAIETPTVTVQDGSMLPPAAPSAEIAARVAELAEQDQLLEERSRTLEVRARELDQRADQLRGDEQALGRRQSLLAEDLLRLEHERQSSERSFADRRQEIERESMRLENRREEITVRQRLWEEIHARSDAPTNVEEPTAAATPTVSPTVEASTPAADAESSGWRTELSVFVPPEEAPASEMRVAETPVLETPASEPAPESEFASALRAYSPTLTFNQDASPAGLSDAERAVYALRGTTITEGAKPTATEPAAAEAGKESAAAIEEQIRRIREMMSNPEVGQTALAADPAPDEVAMPEESEPLAVAPPATAAIEPTPVLALAEVEEPLPQPIQEVAEQPPAAPSHAPKSEEGDEESIEAYMARLLKRVQGEPTEYEKPAPASSLRASMGIEAKAEAPKDQKPQKTLTPPEGEVTTVLHASEFIARSKAPERSAGLEAMRALANHSARTAIDMSNKKKGGQDGMFKLLYAATAGLVGLGLMAWLGWNSLPGIVLGGAGLVLAGLWAMQGYFIQQQAKAQEACGGEVVVEADDPDDVEAVAAAQTDLVRESASQSTVGE